MATRKKDTKDTFEKNMNRLQEIIESLESPDLPLERGMELYREGMQCSCFCRQELEKAKHELSTWKGDRDCLCNTDDNDICITTTPIDGTL